MCTLLFARFVLKNIKDIFKNADRLICYVIITKADTPTAKHEASQIS